MAAKITITHNPAPRGPATPIAKGPGVPVELPEVAKKATHMPECGEVGETGEHGDLGTNAAK
jgi:hypothetical protein